MRRVYEPVYDIDYFIRKFEKIPERLWTTHDFLDDDGRSCAMGHCGARSKLPTDESEALRYITVLDGQSSVMVVNDGGSRTYTQATPKQRILAYLRDIKRKTPWQDR